ncbi:MAG: DEAD/DEAH box helicase [Candidatus Kapabacteria bacterium]|nr:DEAD/DEAH box helicase [Candidatus Kapabacteria bacterium]
MTFAELQLCAPLQKAVESAGYTTPTPIQEQAIPVVMAGRDVFGCAQTGTGKTAAFGLPILHRLHNEGPFRGGPRALILAPTRELAVQIDESIRTYSKGLKIRSVVLLGGVSIRPQIDQIRRGVDIVIATPGRLLDVVDHRALNLSNIHTFVLDEADRMLDMGFMPSIRQIVKLIPTQRQTLFFSATLPREIRDLANSLLIDPVHIAVTPENTTTEMVDQRLYYVERDRKRALLAHLLNDDLEGSVLVFTRTKRGADRVTSDLMKVGLKAASIHGDKSQTARQKALHDFKSGRTRVLVATDIAARGIDIAQLPYVVNFDVPEAAETYVHRIGRTGRAGRSGIAVTLATPEDRSSLRDIEKLIKMRIPTVRDHPFEG